MAEAKVSIGGVDLSAFVASVEIRDDAPDGKAIVLPRLVDGTVTIEGAFSLEVIGQDAHVWAWLDHVEEQAERGLDETEFRVFTRRARKAQRAHARLARAPRKDWWGR